MGGIPSDIKHEILIVNGFERTSGTNNTFDYIRMYGEPTMQNGVSFSSTSNDAVYKGFVNLNDYEIVIWMLLDESTANETFNTMEQGLVADYLKNGGKLMVTGSEIGWDLVEKGSDSDKAFYRDYLRARYISDAPNNQSATFYTANPLYLGNLDGLGDIKFDDGTHGTIDVDWPDAISNIEEGIGLTEVESGYKGITDLSKGYSGISHIGYFGDGKIIGNLVYLAFPFETIYPESQRVAVLEKIMNYMYNSVISVDDESNNTPTEYLLIQNYPNPFNPSTTIKYSIPLNRKSETSNTKLIVFDILGREVATLVNQTQQAGIYEVKFDASGLSSGTYFYRISSGEFFDSKKMILLR